MMSKSHKTYQQLLEELRDENPCYPDAVLAEYLKDKYADLAPSARSYEQHMRELQGENPCVSEEKLAQVLAKRGIFEPCDPV